MNLQDRLYGQNAPPYPLDFVNDIAEAVIRVEEKYCGWVYNNVNYNQKIERVFAYELYHQFKTLTLFDDKYHNLRLDGEIDKRVTQQIEQCDLVIENFTQTRFSPDLVIHLGQTNRQEENQKLIIELKTKRLYGEQGQREIKKTVLKLNHYLRVLNFQYAIFLSVNTDFNQLNEQLNDLIGNPINQHWQERFNRIIVINYKNRILLAKTLKDILTNE